MSVRKTIATYDRIAGEYTRRWQDRGAIAPALVRFTGQLSPGALVLDVGCGPGFDSVTLRSRGLRVMGLDLSWGMLQSARAHYPGAYVQADMRQLPLAGGVEGIWCNAALLHLAREEATRTLRDFHRVLQGDGVVFLSVKEGQAEAQRSDAYGPDAPRFFTFWQDEQLDEALQNSGLHCIESWTDGKETGRWLCRLAKK